MNYFKLAALSIVLTACASGGSMMTMNSYENVPIGATQAEVVKTMGPPIRSKTLEDGSVEYVYVERIKLGGRNVEERSYRIVLKDGKVVSKKVEQSSPPAYTFDSYEMQTTQNGPATPE